MTPASIPIQTIARFAHAVTVYRSFGHFLAVKNGSLLAVPVGLATGDFSGVIDGCPVPWSEVFAAIDTPRAEHTARVLMPEHLAEAAPLVAALFPPHGWVQDEVSVGPGGGTVPRVCSPDGVIFCWVR